MAGIDDTVQPAAFIADKARARRLEVPFKKTTVVSLRPDITSRVLQRLRPKVVKPVEEEENLYVDGNNYNQYVPPNKDVFFDKEDKEDNRNRVVVSTTETTWQHNKGKPTESPEVHRVPPTRNVSFFAQPGILAAVIGGAVVGLLCAILLVMFIVYRMRKKDEGSYALDEPKRAHNANSYSKPPSREFYA